jgi:PPOX class probable F420-dependent enzyme
VSDQAWVAATLERAPVARLATCTASGGVHLVPICFAVIERRLVSAVDHKPKRTTALQRLADIDATGRAWLLVDQYDDDWSTLWWVRVSGVAAVEPPGSALDVDARAALVRKYQQYRERPPDGPVYWIAMDELQWWRAAGSGTGPV